MASALKSSIVRVVGEGSEIAGAGFLVSRRHVLTCAHVVVQALGITKDFDLQPTATVRVNFPFSESMEAHSARVVCWNPVQTDSLEPAIRTEDIAVLELESEPPSDSYSCPVVAADDLWNHAFRTFGFPNKYDEGTWAKGVILDAQAKGWVQIQGTTETGYPVGPGFSGTPVWDETLNAVAGMVVVADKRSELRAAFMIPIGSIIKAWPSFLAEVSDLQSAPKPSEKIAEDSEKVVGRVDATRLFKFRDPEQVLVGKALANPSTRVVSVIGHAGIGKTTLARKVLNDLEEGRWPHTDDRQAVDGIVYLSTQTSGGISFARVFQECVTMLGGKEGKELEAVFSSQNMSTEEKSRRLLDAMKGGLYVILLDDIEDLLDETKQFKDAELQTFFESSLRAADGTRLLVTSRVALSFPVGHTQDDNEISMQQGLNEKDAIALLRELDPNGKGRLLNATEEELREAVNRVHRVPRALELIANKMIQNRLAKLDSILDRFYRQDEVVSFLFKQGYDRLDNNARKVMEALAVFACAVPPAAVQYILDETAPEVDALEVLGQLLSIYMVNGDADAVALHPLDQEYIYNTLPDVGDYNRAMLELRAARYYKEQQTPPESWGKSDGTQPYLREYEHRLRAGDYNGASSALSKIEVDYLIWKGQPGPVQNMRNKLKGKLTDPVEQMFEAYAFGNIHEVLGPLNEAIRWFEKAGMLARDVGHREIECHATGSIGESYRRLGQLEKAIEYLKQATEMSGKFDDVKKHSWHLLSLGLACIYSGDIKSGVSNAKKLIEISEAAGDKMSKAQACDCFSLAYLALGRLKEAIDYSDQAIAVYDEINERNGSMYVLNVHGMAYIGLKQLDQGIDALERAENMAKSDCYARLEGFSLFNQACAYRMLGDANQALQCATDASKKLSDVDAVERLAADALVAAIRAANDNRQADEVRALLDCARYSMNSPDIFDAAYFAEEANRIAGAEALTAEIAEAKRLITENETRLTLPD